MPAWLSFLQSLLCWVSVCDLLPFADFERLEVRLEEREAGLLTNALCLAGLVADGHFVMNSLCLPGKEHSGTVCKAG